MPTTTTTYSFNKPVVGADEDDWGGYLNGNWDSVDDLLDGTTPVTGIDINSGTLDGVTIGGTTAGAGTFTTLTANTSITGTLATAAQPNVTSLGTLTSLTVSGDVSFGDNDKAIFGAGSDLQIYHDGSNSYIAEVGAGNLRVQGTNNVYLQVSSDGGTTWENAVLCDADGPVTLRYNNANKLATTSDGVTLPSKSDDTALSGTSNSHGLHMYQRAYGIAQIDSLVSGASNSGMSLRTYNNGTYTPFIQNIQGNTTTFATAGSEAMRIDSSGNVGIGTSSIASGGAGTTNLNVHTPSATSTYLKLSNTGTGNTASDGFDLSVDSSGNAYLVNRENGFINFYTQAIERMRITSTGRVGIGTTSPSSSLAAGGLHVTDRIAVGAGSTGTPALHYDADTDTGIFFGTGIVAVSTGGTERMRIDSSGNLLVGTTNTFPAGNNVVGTAIRPDGDISITKDGDIAIFANRKTSDGDIMQFRKDGTAVGSIGSVSDKIYIGSSAGGDTFLRLNSNTVAPASSSGADRDATINLGYSGARFQNLLLSGGVYLGGTGAANKLDDYEEGTWTPVFTPVGGGSFTTSTVTEGYYVKVGKMVQISFQIASSGTSSPSGEVQITGLPFTASSQTDNRAGLGIGFVMRFGVDIPNFYLGILDNVSYIRMHKNATNATGSSLVQASDMGSGSNENYIYASGTYQTT